MPYKFEYEHLKIKREDNKNVKLSLEDRETIKKLYATGDYSQRQLAKMFGVSRTLIRLYSNDELLKKHKENFAKRQKDGRYYDKDKQREYIKNQRKHKKQLYDKCKLIK